MKVIFRIIFLFFVVSTSLNAQVEQKVTVKKDIVSVDGIPFFKMISTNYPDAYTVYNLKDEKLAYFSAQFYSDPNQITPGNPQGRIGYFDITFFNEEMDKCEIKIVGFKKHLAQLIIAEKLIQMDKLDNIAVKKFCKVNGFKFSESKNRQNTVIIINK